MGIGCEKISFAQHETCGAEFGIILDENNG